MSEQADLLGITLHQVPNDGNCFYSSVFASLKNANLSHIASGDNSRQGGARNLRNIVTHLIKGEKVKTRIYDAIKMYQSFDNITKQNLYSTAFDTFRKTRVNNTSNTTKKKDTLVDAYAEAHSQKTCFVNYLDVSVLQDWLFSKWEIILVPLFLKDLKINKEQAKQSTVQTDVRLLLDLKKSLEAINIPQNKRNTEFHVCIVATDEVHYNWCTLNMNGLNKSIVNYKILLKTLKSRFRNNTSNKKFPLTFSDGKTQEKLRNNTKSILQKRKLENAFTFDAIHKSDSKRRRVSSKENGKEIEQKRLEDMNRVLEEQRKAFALYEERQMKKKRHASIARNLQQEMNSASISRQQQEWNNASIAKNLQQEINNASFAKKIQKEINAESLNSKTKNTKTDTTKI